ncbi:hypothetical protein [Paraliobacillus ryukyuensis]|uniref:hypothetical protein n=1 Tax=Paraliobacillus ryukyuensis TaxID=200904 RepID=UPI0009A8FF10|nr:hypothetical protein [Paraliobacillus ryukyuensis]
MKKLSIFGALIGIVSCAVLFLILESYSAPEYTFKNTEKYEVSFENAKLIDSKIDSKTGVKIDVYTEEE